MAYISIEIEKDPKNPEVWFHYASAFDFLDREEEAIQHYQKVAELGVEKLPLEFQPQWYLQFGSTLRNVNKLDEARHILQQGIERFPNYAAMKVFLALTEYSSGNSKTAAHLALQATLYDPKDNSLKLYQRAIKNYVAQLKK
ncbi:MAG: hypothetical protein A3I05_01620 [Deltaproteobacteria bacterium RIFCSPLOWO2_02_FULL_44_10]|nr:MAG: hypothetical protein A3C46_05215 [Deltaproteobacteria bacterium RIFCSPHIGHO2_02_FULL_44_16]OGQ45349.1 MAG: hypothetical protein A3I05_01620 [Deltaproteobacteria bacterium RIFCSPLOWO2_02_FULL_44_10]